MVDAGLESLTLLRIVDTEEMPLIDLSEEIKACVDRITWLFIGDGVFNVPGHTQFMCKWLSQAHYYSWGDA